MQTRTIIVKKVSFLHVFAYTLLLTYSRHYYKVVSFLVTAFTTLSTYWESKYTVVESV